MRNEAVALLLVDQRMPEMTGVELLQQAMAIYPNAKRVLLTAYADTEAAIRAINEIQLDHYLMKPWDPPEERLYPVLDDLLDDWIASYRPPFEGIRVIGSRWSPEAYQIKEFLARNLVPYRWLEVQEEGEAQQLLASLGATSQQLPIVVFPNGQHMEQPALMQIAEQIGLHSTAQKEFYDLVIVGGGPAGLAAAVYGSSEGLRTLLIESEAPGGQAGQSSRIENYLGFPVGLSGADLTRRGVAQASRFGTEILTPQEACRIRLQDNYRTIELSDGKEVNCHAILIATGVQYRKLEVPGIEKLTGAGVYYGTAITEALACYARDVFVVGGGNSAGQSALYLAKYARTVNLLVRTDSLAAGMSQYLIDDIGRMPNIKVHTSVNVVGVAGEESVEAVTLEHLDTGERTEMPAAALFIFIGAMPRTEWAADVVERDSAGFILTGTESGAGREATRWLDPRARSLLARGERARDLRGRRRAAPVDQAHRVCGGRRLNGRPIRAPVPAFFVADQLMAGDPGTAWITSQFPAHTRCLRRSRKPGRRARDSGRPRARQPQSARRAGPTARTWPPHPRIR